LAKKEEKIKELEKETQKSDFWEDRQTAAKVQKEISDLKEKITLWQELEKKLSELEKLTDLAKDDEKFTEELEKEAEKFTKTIKQEEQKIFLSGKYDGGSATLTIYSGAGGQDAEDWATMLLRMYQRYCEIKKWKVKILHQHFGEPGGPEGRIGTKNATIEVEGKYAYGFLKNETGVHRLVRISPFSAQKLRHTSFALVEVLPIIEDAENIDIKPDDLVIDFFRSSGPGGQNVNKRETAVRITHLPTKIQVSCQVERSQAQNKEKAMKLLLSKLLVLQEKEKKSELKDIKGEIISASWGNQIRNYVLHPYKLVKDLRTEVESSNPDKVLDGELDDFIEGEIRLN